MSIIRKQNAVILSMREKRHFNPHVNVCFCVLRGGSIITLGALYPRFV